MTISASLKRTAPSCFAFISGVTTNIRHSPAHATPGNGLLLFFRVDDFDEALVRARTLVAALEEEPHVNPNTGTREFALRDPDGYYVMVSALSTRLTMHSGPTSPAVE